MTSAMPAGGASIGEMRNQMRSWGKWLLIFGIISLATDEFPGAPWGLLLLVGALIAFVADDASGFLISSVILLWAAVSNALTIESLWLLVAIIQLLFAAQTALQFRHWRRTEWQSGEVQHGNRPSLLGCFVPACAMLLMVVTLAAGAFLASLDRGVGPGIPLIGSSAVNLAVLGLALGLAAISYRRRHRWLPILGSAGAAIAIVMWFVAAAMGRI